MKVNSNNKNNYYLIVFKSKNYAVQLYYKLEKTSYNVFQLVSTPCQIKGGCTYSLKFYRISDLNYIMKYIPNFNEEVFGIYNVVRKNGKKVYNPIDFKKF